MSYKLPTTPWTNSRSSASESNANVTGMLNTTSVQLQSTLTPASRDLPDPTEAEKEHLSSLNIFFILIVLGTCILVVHLLIKTKLRYLPDSIAVVLVGSLIGGILQLMNLGKNWKSEESFPPTIFFLILLPPIIFESGYNLHKGNFFQNIGSILVFAIFGTVLSAIVVGGCIYLLGQASVTYKFSLVESFAYGSLISAVDPVATLAIFHAIDVDPVLYMLVFGESILNDAVSIVLTKTVMEFETTSSQFSSSWAVVGYALWRFCLMFFASAGIGVVFGLLSSMVLKLVDLRKTPSLEYCMMLIFAYLPYGLAEGIHLSGIMAILACGIVMSHYTHLNLSPITQITVQQTFRSISFIAETCVFAYLGLAIFSFAHNFKPALAVWSIVLILVGRAINIFPLSLLVNYFREHKIPRRHQFIMWFSGLRGAVSFALSLHLSFSDDNKRHVLVTTTLIDVLFTILFLGGSTMPLLKLLKVNAPTKKKSKPSHEVTLSKTKEMGDTVDSEHLSELTEEEYEANYVMAHQKGFLRIDAKFLIPFFTRRFTQEEVRDGRSQITMLTNKWYKEVRSVPSESEGDDVNDATEGSRMMNTPL